MYVCYEPTRNDRYGFSYGSSIEWLARSPKNTKWASKLDGGVIC